MVSNTGDFQIQGLTRELELLITLLHFFPQLTIPAGQHICFMFYSVNASALILHRTDRGAEEVAEETTEHIDF